MVNCLFLLIVVPLAFILFINYEDKTNAGEFNPGEINKMFESIKTPEDYKRATRIGIHKD